MVCGCQVACLTSFLSRQYDIIASFLFGASAISRLFEVAYFFFVKYSVKRLYFESCTPYAHIALRRGQVRILVC